MVAALLAPGKSVLKNVPEIRDVHVVSDLLRLHGVDVDVDGANGIVTIDASRVQLADVADVDTLSGSSRIPILFSGEYICQLLRTDQCTDWKYQLCNLCDRRRCAGTWKSRRIYAWRTGEFPDI